MFSSSRLTYVLSISSFRFQFYRKSCGKPLKRRSIFVSAKETRFIYPVSVGRKRQGFYFALFFLQNWQRLKLGTSGGSSSLTFSCSRARRPLTNPVDHESPQSPAAAGWFEKRTKCAPTRLIAYDGIVPSCAFVDGYDLAVLFSLLTDHRK